MSKLRDWIAPGDELTGPEKARAASVNSRHKRRTVARDWVPVKADELPVEDKTKEEKAAMAELAATSYAETYREDLKERAKQRLPSMTEQDVVTLISTFSESDRQVWLEAEAEGLERNRIFGFFGRPESEDKVKFAGVDTEQEKKPARSKAQRPLESTSASDRMARAAARVKEGGDVPKSSAARESEAAVAETFRDEDSTGVSEKRGTDLRTDRDKKNSAQAERAATPNPKAGRNGEPDFKQLDNKDKNDPMPANLDLSNAVQYPESHESESKSQEAAREADRENAAKAEDTKAGE